MKTASPHRASAFTLIEILIVVGIIGVLVALLLPALARVRQQGRQITCLNNLRALGAAMMVYASDNDGMLPATAQALPANEDPADWLWWQQDRISKYMDAEVAIRRSALAKYVPLGVANPGVLKCPSDNFETHQAVNPNPAFPSSYVMNCFIASRSSVNNQPPPTFTPWQGPNPPAFNFALCRSLHRVVNPSQKVLMYEQSELTINDGDACPWYGASAAPTSTNPYWSGCAGGIDLLSARHDLANYQVSGDPSMVDVSNAGKYTDVVSNPCAVPFVNARGNVVFCDGHADFVARGFVHLPEHTVGGY